MGKATMKAFNQVETFTDLQEGIRANIQYLTNGYFHGKGVDLAIKSINEMDEATQTQALRFMHHVDRKLSMGGTAKGNLFHKIPTIMAGFIYLTYFKEQVKDLSLDELIVLSRFSIIEPPSFYATAVDYLGPELLNVAVTKHVDYMHQSTFLGYGESKIRSGMSKEEAAAYIRETPIDALTEETYEWERQELQKVGKYI